MQAVAEVDMPKSVNLSEANGKQLQRLLVLEGLQDPGNLVGPSCPDLPCCLIFAVLECVAQSCM